VHERDEAVSVANCHAETMFLDILKQPLDVFGIGFHLQGCNDQSRINPCRMWRATRGFYSSRFSLDTASISRRKPPLGCFIASKDPYRHR
jgi:hypothetical protein